MHRSYVLFGWKEEVGENEDYEWEDAEYLHNPALEDEYSARSWAEAVTSSGDFATVVIFEPVFYHYRKTLYKTKVA